MILDLVGFAYVLRPSTISQDLLRFHHPTFPCLFKTIEIEYCFGPTRNKFRSSGAPYVPKK